MTKTRIILLLIGGLCILLGYFLKPNITYTRFKEIYHTITDTIKIIQEKKINIIKKIIEKDTIYQIDTIICDTGLTIELKADNIKDSLNLTYKLTPIKIDTLIIEEDNMYNIWNIVGIILGFIIGIII